MKQSFLDATGVRRRVTGTTPLLCAAMLAGISLLCACSGTRVYNWKPQQSRMRAGGGVARNRPPTPAPRVITPELVLDDSGAPENQPVWVAVPAGRDGSIVWVQMMR